jgi:uncharacterized protein (UPF0261 family)
MDLTLHELVYEGRGEGFGYAAGQRLAAGAAKGIPMVVAPGGLDFICLWPRELTGKYLGRKMIWHNSRLAHVKLSLEEALSAAALATERLNRAQGMVSMVFPRGGLRSLTKPGEPLGDPALDEALLSYFQKNLKKSIPILTTDSNLMDEDFSALAASETLRLMERAGIPKKGEENGDRRR